MKNSKNQQPVKSVKLGMTSSMKGLGNLRTGTPGCQSPNSKRTFSGIAISKCSPSLPLPLTLPVIPIRRPFFMRQHEYLTIKKAVTIL